MNSQMISPSLALRRFTELIGPLHVLTEADRIAPYLVEWRDLFKGETPAVLRPGTVDEVSAILKAANELGTPLVPQGGNTGLVGGQIPTPNGDEFVLSLGRLDAVREIDRPGDTITAEAGVTLERLHQAAETVDRIFPLTLASQGSCCIGGNLSTNAGGTAVLSYGNMRDLVLGLEVVLPTGEIWNGLTKLRKDNTGYDLKHLFIGAEGTLGVITAAALKLFPKPRGVETAFAGLANPNQALALLSLAKGRAGPALTGFELMPRIGIEFALKHLPSARDPLEQPHAWYVLAEISSGHSPEEARLLLEEIFNEALAGNVVADVAVATSSAQSTSFWRLRHGLSEVQKHEGGSIKHDISVPVSSVPDFLDEALAAVAAFVPGCRPVPFGHMGDGNIHFNITQPVGADKAAFLDRWDAVNALVHGIVARHRGSISAEHGIGRLKRDALADVKSPLELDLMRRIKRQFDPNNILNPGRIFS